MRSPRPPPLAWKARKLESIEGCKIVDVRRCRKRALEFNIHEVPVYCPLDDVQPSGTLLGDIVYCSRPSKCPLRDLGFTGCIAVKPSFCSITALSRGRISLEAHCHWAPPCFHLQQALGANGSGLGPGGAWETVGELDGRAVVQR